MPPIKSILKTSSTTPSTDEQNTQLAKNRRNLAIALHHAKKIQQQKDVQSKILNDIESLLDIPVESPYTTSEAQTFKTAVARFQPSDFDSLVEERSGCERCAYVLCSRKTRSAALGASAAWKLSSVGAGDYCGDGCMRKAFFVKAQLSELPAWEREPGQQSEIVLFGEDLPSQAGPQEVQRRVNDNSDLAAERGESKGGFRPKQVMKDVVVEKEVAKPPDRVLSATKAPHQSYAAIEGYEPKTRFRADSVSSSLNENDHDPDTSVNDTEAEDPGADESDPENAQAWRDMFSYLDGANGPGR